MIDSPSSDVADAISQGRTALGIELGSTRIKAVLVGADHAPLATGSHDWENQFVDRVWTYSLESVWEGLQACYRDLADQVQLRYGVTLTTVGSLGVSAMMHGYLPFNAAGEQLAEFRTWRNTITGEAATELTDRFGYNIPQRWSIAHLRQAILGGEAHVGAIAHLTTLAGYVHWRLSGSFVLGVGDASGMFPIDQASGSYHAGMLASFDALVSAQVPWSLADVLPTVLSAGADAGSLTEQGAALLDPTGTLQAGIPLCPPEGDAGTGMVATNAVAPRTGNVSAGTSIFAMVVLERELSTLYRELDLVTTPAGDPVAMVHCNNGASELNAWVGLFGEFAHTIGADLDQGLLFQTLFGAALSAEPDAGGLLSYNYLSGEHLTDLAEGRPLFTRTPDSRFTLANFMRSHLLAAFATLAIGMEVLHGEGVELDSMFAHGGIFKTPVVGQRLLAAALDTTVSVGDIAGEGGAWGIAVLAGFRRWAAPGQSLADYLATVVFADAALVSLAPEPEDVAGFATFLARFRAGLAVERAAVASL